MLADRKDELRVLMSEGKPGRLRAVPKPSTSRNSGVQARLLLWLVRRECTFLYIPQLVQLECHSFISVRQVVKAWVLTWPDRGPRLPLHYTFVSLHLPVDLLLFCPLSPVAIICLYVCHSSVCIGCLASMCMSLSII